MKRFLIAMATVAIIIFAVQMTAYGATTTVIKSEWVSDNPKVSGNATFDLELEFDEVLKAVHGFLLTNFHNTDEITEMADESKKWAYMSFNDFAPPEGELGNVYMFGSAIGSKYGAIDAYAYYLTDETEGKTHIYLNGMLIQYGRDLTGIAILGELDDGTMINVWGRKTGLSVMNLHGVKNSGFLTVNIVLKIPENEVVPEKGAAIFRINVSTKYENFDRVLKLPEDAEPAEDGYYYISDHFNYHSPTVADDSPVNTVTVRQKPSALYETDQNICSMDLYNTKEVTMDIEWTERIRKSEKTVYAAGETH